MTEFLELLSDPAASISQTQPWVDFCEEPLDIPLLGLNPAEADLECSVQLDFGDLSSCTIVEDQFEVQGVRFANAIALRPSNPAYRSDSGEIVLMGAPKSGYLEARFLRPVQFVSGSVTSSRRTVLTVFDEHNQTIACTETPGTNLADAGAYPANMPLRLSAANIHRVTFHAFDGQLTLADFCFNPA